MVAAARAIETHRDDALARDVYAEHFVRAARASVDWPVRLQQVPDGDADPLWGRFARYFGLRTRVLDDFLLRQVRTGSRQVVLLGAGLDTRAYRLGWPPGCAVYEIDQEEVLAFKDRVLDGLRATPKAERVTIGADLRLDWATALTGAGFDPAAPTAWLAEGLLLYLPQTAERALIATVDELSAAGSALAYEVKLGTESAAVRESPIYSAAKWAVVGLAKSLALALAPDRIRVNVVCPFLAQTPMKQAFVGRSGDAAQAAANEARLIAAVPMGRLVEPGEVADAVLWLVSAEASFVTGVALPIDGGFTAR